MPLGTEVGLGPCRPRTPLGSLRRSCNPPPAQSAGEGDTPSSPFLDPRHLGRLELGARVRRARHECAVQNFPL